MWEASLKAPVVASEYALLRMAVQSGAGTAFAFALAFAFAAGTVAGVAAVAPVAGSSGLSAENHEAATMVGVDDGDGSSKDGSAKDGVGARKRRTGLAFVRRALEAVNMASDEEIVGGGV